MTARLGAAALLLLLPLAACDTAGPATTATAPVTLQVTGGLETEFEGEAVEARAEAAVRDWPQGRQLLLQLQATRLGRDEERAQLELVLPLDAEGDLPAPGDYRITLGERDYAVFSYRLDREPELSARYRFEAEEVLLQIERAEGDWLTGRLSLIAEQVQGLRILHGQSEEVTLSGPARVQATFEATVRE